MPRTNMCKPKDEVIFDRFMMWLQHRIKKEKITQKDIAGWLGVTQPAVSYILGSKSISLSELLKIAVHLNLEPGEMAEHLM